MATNNYNNYSINNNNSPNFLLIQLSWRTANYIAASQNPVKKYMESLYNIVVAKNRRRAKKLLFLHEIHVFPPL
jgi:hypothetical protein